MKYFILPFIAFLILGSANAQINYESPHVADGKTIQFTLPAGYFEVRNGSFDGNVMYASQEGLDLEVDEIDNLPIGMLAVIHVPAEDQTMASFKDELTQELIDRNSGIILVGKPEILKVNGRDCLYAGLKGEIEGEAFGGVYFSVIEFGNYFIVISYYAADEIDDLLDYKDFKKIIKTWKVVATEKEDGLAISDKLEEVVWDDFEEEMYVEEEETNYRNDLFPTNISYYDILPDLTENWDMPSVENSHLLSEFIYKKDKGTMKVFSGGAISDYPSTKEMAKAIQSVIDLPTRLGLKKDSEFSNEDHFFQLYTISGGGTMTSVYTTLVNNELVFFVIDGGSNPIPDFKPAVRDFMLTMWVDYFEAEIEAPIEEK